MPMVLLQRRQALVPPEVRTLEAAVEPVRLLVAAAAVVPQCRQLRYGKCSLVLFFPRQPQNFQVSVDFLFYCHRSFLW